MAGGWVGYARVSTCDQQAGLDAQVRGLKAAGCEEIFAKQVSERQRDGVAKARLDLAHIERKPTARAKKAEAVRLNADGLQRTEIARRTGTGVVSVYRELANARRASGDQSVAAV
jgi:DNA invertase Pin-like site-specific DNA recombinase